MPTAKFEQPNRAFFDSPCRPGDIRAINGNGGGLQESASFRTAESSRLHVFMNAYSQMNSDLSCRLTSISSCLGACELLVQSSSISPEHRESIKQALEIANAELTRASVMVRTGRKLLGNAKPGAALQSLTSLIEETVELYRARCETSGIRLELHLQPLPHIVFEMNAIKHLLLAMMNHSVDLLQSNPKQRRCLSISACTKGDFIETTIVDSRPTQNGQESKGVFPDLAVCRQIVAEHSGNLREILTNSGQTGYCIRLPLHAKASLSEIRK